jgi:hypothetical protein
VGSPRGRIKGVEGWRVGGWGGARAGRLSYFIHLSCLSRVIKLLYAPASPPPQSMGPDTSLLGSSHPWSISG